MYYAPREGFASNYDFKMICTAAVNHFCNTETGYSNLLIQINGKKYIQST